MLLEQLLMHAWLPAEATSGAVVGQQIFPAITTSHVLLQVYAVEFKYYRYGQ